MNELRLLVTSLHKVLNSWENANLFTEFLLYFLQTSLLYREKVSAYSIALSVLEKEFFLGRGIF